MFPDVKAVRYVDNYRLELMFEDGVHGILDFADWVVGKGGVFARLEDRAYFAQVSVNADVGTIVWPNDVDFDPEVLYSSLTGKAIAGMDAAVDDDAIKRAG
jgi:hypothetical protein